MLIAFPYAGLANRLRLLASADRIARALGMRLGLHWPLQRGCRCAFGDLFENAIPEIGLEQLKKLRPAVFYGDKLNAQRASLQDPYVAKVANRIPRSSKAPHIVIHSCSFVAFNDEPKVDGDASPPDRFRREISDYYRTLRPIAEVRQRVEEYAGRLLTPKTVGVHVRRTDHRVSRSCSTDAAFIRCMDGLIARDTEVNFFLATDCPQTESLLIERFGDERVRVYPKRGPREATDRKALDRGTREGVQDALVDLLLLSRTSAVLGSRASSYSQAAELFSGRLDQVTFVTEAQPEPAAQRAR